MSLEGRASVTSEIGDDIRISAKYSLYREIPFSSILGKML
jgi:hypothetical protein